jgi:hypothetical protein
MQDPGLEGGAESLRGRISVAAMGSRAARESRPVQERQYRPLTKENTSIYEIWLGKCKRLLEEVP